MSRMQTFSPQGYRRILGPAILFSLSILLFTVLWITMRTQSSLWERLILFAGLGGSVYGLFWGLILSSTKSSRQIRKLDWVHILVVGISLGIVAQFLPADIFFVVYILFILNMISATLLFSAAQVRVLILIAFLVHLQGSLVRQGLLRARDWFFILSFPALNLIVFEIIHRFQKTIADNLQQVTTINAISRTLSSSLDEDEVHAWFQEAIQNIFEADTYYLALLNGDELDLGLFYDDGEYYPAVRLPMEGTLGGWAIRNRKTLFLNDLRTEPQLDGVRTRLVGKEKSSLSWLGVPFHAEYVTGLTGIASYSPLAFTNRDVEMLESLTQQAALALNNARQHKLMIEQARLDSMTKIYNHGYFLVRLNEELDLAAEEQYPLSVIMLDVDFFKSYNDTYGHLVGDEVLMLMVKTIQRFIKKRDSIGRWGGEEFAICLPKTSLKKAQQVAVRIQETLEKMHISVLDHKNIPVPTVSQGIAEFPREAGEAFELVDLADQRLYTAKERGRNQIEPRIRKPVVN